MDSVGDVRKAKTTPYAGCPAGGVDLISGLDDDVLVHILELLPDARDTVRTGALSRRWRGLWTSVPALRFVSGSWREFRKACGPERFVAFVNDALALLAAAQTEPAVERLAISFTALNCTRDQKQLATPYITAAAGWIQYVARHAVKSFALELRLRPAARKMALDELPSFAKLETLRLALGDARMQLPATAVFPSLVDLSLESIEFVEGSGHLLARLLASECCPRLQKLHLGKLMLESLLLEADALSELSWEGMHGPWTLELRTPNLRVVRMGDCHGYLKRLMISAPRLEVLAFLHDRPNRIEIAGELPCIGSLNAQLWSHGYADEDDDDDEEKAMNDVSIRLLQCCTSLQSLDVSLLVTKSEYQVVDIINGRIPHLPHVKSLRVHVSLSKLHSFGAGLAHILTQCSNNVRYLRLHLKCYIDMGKPELDFLCNHPDHGKSNEISLSHLQEVEFRELSGTDCELWLMQSVLSSARNLQKVAISFNPRCRLESRRDPSELMPLLPGGTWTACRGNNLSYEWRPSL